MERINRWLAERITRAVGTMWCAYAFALLSFVSLPAAIGSGDVVIIIGWVAQTFLQLVLLSILAVGQQVQAESTEEVHAKLDGHHAVLASIHSHLKEHGQKTLSQ